MLVYGASNQFFSGTGFAGDQHRGIGGGHFHYTGEHGLQRRRRAHNLLKHEDLINLLPERKVFVTHPLLGPLAILNIGPSRVPANNVPLIVAKRIVTDQKPPIVTVFSKRSLLKFKRLTARETLMALLAQPFQILGVEDPCALVFSLHVLQSETGVIEQCLICIKGCPVRAQHVNITGDGVGHPPKLCFLRLYFLKRSLQSRSRFVLLGDIHRRTDYFNDITRSIHYRVSDHVNVLGRAVWQNKPIVDLKVASVSNGLLDHRSVTKHVLRVQPPAYLDLGWWRGTGIEAKDPVQFL